LALVRESRSVAEGEQIKAGPAAEPEKFANYHILKRSDGTLFRLGPGAMGVTYEAFDTSLDRHVALKVIAADLLGSEEARRPGFLIRPLLALELRSSRIFVSPIAGEQQWICTDMD
jgi:hypothetical protein